MLHKLLPWLLMIALMQAGKARGQCSGAPPLVIDHVAIKELRCPASGGAQVQVSGGVAPYYYSLTSGPKVVPAQSSNEFTSLPVGWYGLEVRDACNNVVTRNIRIVGSYAPMVVSNTLVSPSCTGNADGALTVIVNSGGRAPYTYELIAPSTVVRPPQVSNVFNLLPAGQYTYRVQDSCGNIQTRSVTLLERGATSLSGDFDRLQWVSCDSFYFAYRITSDASSYFGAAFQSKLQLPNGVVLTHSFPSPTAVIRDTFRFRYVHTSYTPDDLLLTVTNACGRTSSRTISMDLDMRIYQEPIGGCNNGYRYTFDRGTDNGGYQNGRFVHCGSITYTLVNPLGVVVATQVNNSTFSGFPSGPGYKVVRETCCSKDSLTFHWQDMPDHKLSFRFFPGCKEGTAVLQLSNAGADSGMVVLVSGPPSVTFRDGSVHQYNYPDTVREVFNASRANMIGFLGEGTYRLHYIGHCGHRDTLDINVLPSHLKQGNVNVTLVKGCVNDNKIVWQGNYGYSVGDDIVITHGSTRITRKIIQTPFKDSLVNLAAGNYTVELVYNLYSPQLFLRGMRSIGCDRIAYPINIPVYRQPRFFSESVIASCGSDRLLSMLPDSSSGLLPFWYEITAGPAIPPGQGTPVFTNLPKGTYSVRMTDACGNSYSNNLAFDTVMKPEVAFFLDCQNSIFEAYAQTAPGYHYSWVFPDGSLHDDFYINLSPFSIADTGYYRLNMTSNVNGCISQADTTLRLDLCMILPVDLLHFKGQRVGGTVALQWKLSEVSSCQYFVVERSADGSSFEPAGQVAFKDGALAYEFTDRHPIPGKAWYRLRIVEEGSRVAYSNTIALRGTAADAVSIFPVPVEGIAYLKHPPAGSQARILLTDVQGKVLMSPLVVKGSRQSTLDVTGLPPGTYLVVYSDAGLRQTVKLIKQ